ncbi:MAG: discoidin domain-containing protein [Nitrospirae bacterium]|nr:discoidin domain-containing protein [Nitrospirota bacterium]
METDDTLPTSVITYPHSSDQIGNVVEVKGTADDLHFKNYTLETGEGDNPASWTAVSSGTTIVKENVLGKWNTYGLTGRWTLRLTANDTAGNKNQTTVTIDLSARKDLIKDLSVSPNIFSPNNDGRYDTAEIKYEITDACQVKIDISDSTGAIRRTYSTTTPSAGVYSYTWDGKDNAGTTIPDGTVGIKLSTTLSSNTSVTQDEAITMSVDSTLPTVDIKQPANNSYLKSDITVSGTINDQNLLDYSITYSGPSSGTLDQGSQTRDNYTFGILSQLSEGKYTLKATANDSAKNSMQKDITFTVDRTLPKILIESPKEGEYYGSSKNIISITGSITEDNLETYKLRYGFGDNPTQWTDLISGNTIPTNSQLYSWKVGKDDGIADGLYTLSLYAKDKAGSEAEIKIKVTVDNTQPETAITAPQNNGYVKETTDIKGTAFDQNLDNYTVETSDGECSNAFKWTAIKTSTTSVKDGTLASWQTFSSDGTYCIRLTAKDKLENKAEAKVAVNVDTHPPSAPVLSGQIEDKSGIRLTWTQDSDTDISGYNIYRDGQKQNTALVSGLEFLDQNLTEGSYAYTIKAVDRAGWESESSNEVKITIDLTGPNANISSPANGSTVSGTIDIKGTAYSSDDFKQHKVYTGQGTEPAAWSLIRTSPVPTSYGVLTQWETVSLPEGTYSIKLEAEDISGNINTDKVTVTIDNTPPGTPVLLSASPNSSDVTVTWQANTDADLSGYLLYRNDQLANATGIVISSLKSYVITGTQYTDKSVPDGRFTYYLIAMDQAENLSDQSNTIEINIDTHAPKATISEPADKSKFENKTLVTAGSSDSDIASIQFQYKKSQDSTWLNLGSALTSHPYSMYLDPAVVGLTYGDYNLRAVATDNGGKADSSPSYITITYTDLTAPNTPIDLKALTTGKDVTLTWTANSETDLNGYYLYRTSGSTKTKLNSSALKDSIYQDKGLSDGTYTYEVRAIDTFNNESGSSNTVTAKVYIPKITQPYTPSAEGVIQLSGSNAEANSTVEITVKGYGLHGTATADSTGNFNADVTLTAGENKITVQAKDSAGNISRTSDMVVVVYNEPPSAPTGLTISVTDHNVALTWNPNPETDISGYNIYRDGERLNTSSTLSSGTATASSYLYSNSYYAPTKAFDGDSATYWRSDYSYNTFSPEWWELDLPSSELINHIEISWYYETYVGKDFEIQAWSGYTWITLTKVTGNSAKTNILDFNPYRTDKIRIYITLKMFI